MERIASRPIWSRTGLTVVIVAGWLPYVVAAETAIVANAGPFESVDAAAGADALGPRAGEALRGRGGGESALHGDD